AARGRADDRHRHAHPLGDRRPHAARGAARRRTAPLRRPPPSVLRQRGAPGRGRIPRPRHHATRTCTRLHAADGRGVPRLDTPADVRPMPLPLYVPARTVLHRLHPVTKIGLLGAFVVAAFVVDRPLVLVPLGGAIAGLLVLAHAGANVRRLRAMFVLVFVFTLVVWTWFFTGFFRPSYAGFLYGLATASRLDAFLAAGLLFLSITRVEEVAYALGRLGVPYAVGFTLTLAFRLVPAFFDAAASVVQAQRCRGLELASGSVVTRLRRYV